jgi:hypothetical protein
MEELEAEQIPLLPLPPPPLLSPPLSLPPPQSVSAQLVPLPPPVGPRDSDNLLTPLPDSFTEMEQDDFHRELLHQIRESSQGASDEAFCDDQLRLLDYIRINARSSDSGISCCAHTVYSRCSTKLRSGDVVKKLQNTFNTI